MKFEAKTKEEIETGKLLPDGVYPFTVTAAEDTVSKSSGNDMIALTLQVFGDDKTIFVRDWILESMEEKLWQFCRFTGLEEKYDAGTLEAFDCDGREGWVKLKTEKPKPGSSFPPKNAVAFYCPKPESATAPKKPAAAKPGPEFDEDDIKF